MINIDALNDEEKLAALESIHKSIAESKEIQRKKITTNVEMIVKALKKIEADLKQRYDETGQLIANLKSGEDGRDGKDGKDGKNGKDGRDGPMGPRGYDGVPGRNGLDGTDGVSVTDAHIDFDGSLIISLSSGRVINVGEVVAADIAEKIKVITNGGGTSQSVLDAIASLQAQIDAIASGLEYQGTWNASTNVPTLASSVGTAGYYYIVATAGSTNLNGITDWQIGDWAVFNGTIWQKIDQSNLVTSVAGRTGAIVLTTADIGGLGTIATQAANNVSITGGSITGITDLAIADGGTGASTANAAFNALAPSQTGNSGKYLTTDGTDTSWATNPLGTVTSVSGTGTVNGLTLTGTVTTSGSLTLGGTLSGIANSALTNSSITINGSATSLGGSINVGTVTSVAATVPSFLSIGGSPVTSSGTLAITLSGTALPTTSGGTGLTSFTTNGVVYASSTSALATGSALTFDGSKLVNTGYNISAYQVSTGAVSTFESVGGGYLTYDGAGGASVYSRLNATTENALTLRASSFSFRIGGTQVASLGSSNLSLYNSQLLFAGATSGYTGFAAPAVSNFTVYTLPSSDGTNGQSLTTNGSGTLSWVSGTGGTVTSVGGTGTVSGLTLTGTVTSSGNLTLGGALDLSAYNGAGAFTTLSASSTVTLSGGTANGVAYLNGSKVVTSGSALTFDGTNLSVGAAGSSSTWGKFVSVDGNYPGIVFNSTATSGRKFSVGVDATQWLVRDETASATRYLIDSSGNSIWSVGGSEQMRLTSTGLGIGTSSPAYKLQVGDGSADTRGLFLSNNNFSIGVGRSTGTIGGYIGSPSSDVMVFSGNGGAEKMRLDSPGNLGIGTSSPSALAANYTTVDIRGATGGALRFGNATDSAYIYSDSNETNIATATNKRMIFSINTSEKMRLDTSGNLGLGVTPSAWSLGKAIEVGTLGSALWGFGSTYLTNNAYYNSGWKYASTAASSYYQQNAGIHYWFNAPSGTAGNAITFTQAMTLDASGNLSLGFTGGASRFEARGPMYVPAANFKQLASFLSTDALGANVGAGITLGGVFQDSSVTSFAQIAGIKENATSGDYGGALALYTRPNGDTLQERARITSGGDLLVGRTSVSISGVKVDAEGLFGSIKSGNWSWSFGASASTNAFVINDTTTGSATERARIDSSGNLMVGRTSLSSGNTGTILTSGGGITSEISFTGTNEIAVFNQVSTGTTQIDFRYQAVASGYIEWNSTTTSYITSSDYRLKNTIAPMTGALAKVALLKPCTYKWNANGSDGEGFIAHELAEVCPQAVSGEKDAVDKDGSPKYQGVDTSFLVATLTAAIQEQQAIIESLKARLDAANL